ncbi:hypothetical protein HMI54_002610 [Coelomomyces lativittatus]|nr:hypothetical protein HMI54_002610 [Coelomomyces lativittatus]
MPQGQLKSKPVSFLNTGLLSQLRSFSSSKKDSHRTTPSTTPSSSTVSSFQIKEKHENIYTLPNLLSFTRLMGSPFLGYLIVLHHYESALILFSLIALTDLLDGFIARQFHMKSVMGTILDPLADKTFMTTLAISLGHAGLIPVPLSVLIVGRDVVLILSSFFIRYKSLPSPKTWSRFWDFSLPTAEVHPTLISKINTGCQFLFMGLALASPIFDSVQSFWEVLAPTFHVMVATTTVWSGLSYLYSNKAIRYVHKRKA